MSLSTTSHCTPIPNLLENTLMNSGLNSEKQKIHKDKQPLRKSTRIKTSNNNRFKDNSPFNNVRRVQYTDSLYCNN